MSDKEYGSLRVTDQKTYKTEEMAPEHIADLQKSLEELEVVYLYYDKETASIIDVLEEPDEHLPYDYIRIPRSEIEAVMRSIEVPTKGYAYYTGQWGHVLGISLKKSDEFGDSPFVEISMDVANQFLEGDLVLDDFAVSLVPGDTEPRLIRKIDPRCIVLKELGDWELLMEGRIDHDVKIIVTFAEQSRMISFYLENYLSTGSDGLVLQQPTMSVRIVQKDDTSNVYQEIEVDLNRLTIDGEVHVPYTSKAEYEQCAIYTKKVLEATFVEHVYLTQDHSARIKLPDEPFLDVVKMPAGEPGQHFSVVIDKPEKKIVIKAPPGAPIYDRQMWEYPLVFTRKNDPTIILHALTLNPHVLKHKRTVFYSLPEGLIQEEFDAFMPLVFGAPKITIREMSNEDEDNERPTQS